MAVLVPSFPGLKMAMRQTTRYSMVSSIQDDSLGSKHLPGDIYAFAETTRGETAACSHPRRSTFTVRALHGVTVTAHA